MRFVEIKELPPIVRSYEIHGRGRRKPFEDILAFMNLNVKLAEVITDKGEYLNAMGLKATLNALKSYYNFSFRVLRRGDRVFVERTDI